MYAPVHLRGQCGGNRGSLEPSAGRFGTQCLRRLIGQRMRRLFCSQAQRKALWDVGLMKGPFSAAKPNVRHCGMMASKMAPSVAASLAPHLGG